MCLEKKFCFILVVFLFLFCLLDALQAEEQEPWYLISETELRSIEQYKATSEKEKQNWLSQVNALKIRAEKSEADSSLLNSQLAQARERNRKLEQSFNEYETGQLTLVSLKNGEIAELKQQLADKGLETEKWKGKATARLIIIIAVAAVVILIIAFKIFLWIKGGAAASLIKSFLGR